MECALAATSKISMSLSLSSATIHCAQRHSQIDPPLPLTRSMNRLVEIERQSSKNESHHSLI
jgi:hypothetical protein